MNGNDYVGQIQSYTLINFRIVSLIRSKHVSLFAVIYRGPVLSGGPEYGGDMREKKDAK